MSKEVNNVIYSVAKIQVYIYTFDAEKSFGLKNTYSVKNPVYQSTAMCLYSHTTQNEN